MRGADQSGLVRIIANDPHLGLDLFVLQQHRSAANRELTDAAAGKSAAEHDAFGIFPGLQLEKATKHAGKFLREGFNRSLNDAG